VSVYLIDTDYVIDALHGTAHAVQTLVDLAPQGLAISLITYGELYQGAYYARNPSTARQGLQRFLTDKELLPVTPAIAEQFGVIRGGLSRPLQQQIGDMDLLIAATAIAYDLTLLTRNVKDFQHIPGLKLYRTS
jgi:tRNA(fMet)-specific endonuclease VapC